jgi:hypothetical protein
VRQTLRAQPTALASVRYTTWRVSGASPWNEVKRGTF